MSLTSSELLEAVSALRFDSTVRAGAARCLTDWIGCAVGGAASEATRTALGVVQLGPYGASLIGSPGSTSPRDAAFVNAVSGHALDYDDENTWLFGHPAATIVPAVLALGERRGAGLGQVLRSIATGYEAAAILGRSANPGHYLAGWHATAVLGSLASALACADLLELDAERSSACLTLASVQSSGLRAVFGSDVKALQVGLAASSAVMAAELAERVQVPVPDALGSLLDMMGASGQASPPSPSASSTHAAILDTTFKYHATCGATHPLIEAVRAAVQEHGVDASDIRVISAYVNDLAATTAGVTDPGSLHEAQFSLGYLAALAVTEYPITPDVIWPPTARTRDLYERCTVRVDDEHAGDHHHPARVEIELRSGALLTKTVRRARGSTEWPLGDADLSSKFVGLSRVVLGSTGTESVQRLLEEASDDLPIGRLMLLLTGRRDSSPASVQPWSDDTVIT